MENTIGVDFNMNFGGMDPKQMSRLMKQFGIESQDIKAEKVIIETSEGKLVIENPHVVRMKMQGQDMFQVVATSVKEEPSAPKGPSSEDVALVADQSGASREEAAKALIKTNGDIAEAIMLLKNE